MALTVIFALTGSLICALTLVPVLASVFLRTGAHREPRLGQYCSRLHNRIALATSRRPALVIGATAVLLGVSLTVAPFLGTEFVPTLDEGTFLLDVMQAPSISLTQAVKNSTAAEKAMLEVPEVTRVVSRIGRPEIATDTMGPDESDVYVFLKPRSQWKVSSRDMLIAEIERKLNQRMPDMSFGFTQPIEERLNDMIAGVKADVAIHIYGPDLDEMQKLGTEILEAIGSLSGAADLKMIPRTGLPSINIQIDRDAIARYGINASDVFDAVEAIGGKIVGQVVEGEARFPLQVRFDGSSRSTLDDLDDIKITTPNGALIPLVQLATLKVSQGPLQIWRQNGIRRITVAANVRGTDLGSFVTAARRTIANKIKLPHGYRLEWGGEYENLQRASRRLMILVPASLLLILVLLYNTFSSMGMALLIFGNVLLAAAGGILALMARQLTFSITAGVGFITLFGVSVLNGVVLISEINRLRLLGHPVIEAIELGSRERLRPILMASLVALFGFIPMAVAHSAGAEVQRPLATVVIGGLITSTPFALYVLPIIYRWLVRNESSRVEPTQSSAVILNK